MTRRLEKIVAAAGIGRVGAERHPQAHPLRLEQRHDAATEHQIAGRVVDNRDTMRRHQSAGGAAAHEDEVGQLPGGDPSRPVLQAEHGGAVPRGPVEHLAPSSSRSAGVSQTPWATDSAPSSPWRAIAATSPPGQPRAPMAACARVSIRWVWTYTRCRSRNDRHNSQAEGEQRCGAFGPSKTETCSEPARAVSTNAANCAA
jgi:hypothetical protein